MNLSRSSLNILFTLCSFSSSISSRDCDAFRSNFLRYCFRRCFKYFLRLFWKKYADLLWRNRCRACAYIFGSVIFISASGTVVLIAATTEPMSFGVMPCFVAHAAVATELSARFGIFASAVQKTSERPGFGFKDGLSPGATAAAALSLLKIARLETEKLHLEFSLLQIARLGTEKLHLEFLKIMAGCKEGLFALCLFVTLPFQRWDSSRFPGLRFEYPGLFVFLTTRSLSMFSRKNTLIAG